MLSKKQFCKVIDFINKIERRDNEFNEALQKFAGDKDFTGFYSNTNQDVLEWLEETMHDEDDLISWWLYDCPEAGKCKDDNSCTIWLDKDQDEKFVIRTAEDLYDYLLQNMHAPDDDVMAYAFKQQTEGVKFAIHLIDKLEMTNNSTGNEGFEDRSALLKLAKNKIRHEYMIDTGAEDPAPEYPIKDISLITKGVGDD